ncbi:MAG TPA: lipopolysaccharide heptosyltransferase I [Pyrinomonadaceae bacterium]|nr:lipopolysaccharide heptosyltransferase I [Pyrinomonadaceae bacterium]
MKILIVKLGSIGDIVHTLPALAAIRRALPQAEISWVAENRSAEILRGGSRNQFLSHLIEVDTKALRHRESLGETLLIARQQLRGLRASAFDIALDFQGLLKSAAIAKLAKATRRYGFAREALREPASRFLLTDAVAVPRKIHVIRKNLMLAQKALKIPVPDRDFEFPIFTEKTHVEEAEKIVSRAGGNLAILNPAGGWTTKLWHAEKFGALADRLWEENGLIPVVTTAPNENALAEKVLKNSKSGKAFAVNLSLKGFYELAKRARIYVGGDTGPTHLAAAAKAPMVGIFGPTEWWRNGSPNEADIAVGRADIECRTDCHRRACENWICMDISVAAVFDAVQKRLKNDL